MPAVDAQDLGESHYELTLVRVGARVQEFDSLSASIVPISGSSSVSVGASIRMLSPPVVGDWCDRGLSWLLAQFRDSTRLRDVICAGLDEAQGLELAHADLRARMDLDNAVGANLDIVGALLGFRRDPGLSDVLYRTTLRAVARANRSFGTPEDMIETAAILLGDAACVLSESYPASIRVIADSPLSFEDGHRYARVLRRAAPASTNFAFMYAPISPTSIPILDFGDNLPEEGIPGTYLIPWEEDSGL